MTSMRIPPRRMKKIPSNAPSAGVGNNCVIVRSIIDKNARIGDNVILNPEGKEDGQYPHGITVRDGILIVSKDAIVPSNTVL